MPQSDARDDVLLNVEHVLDGGIHHKFDFRIGACALQHDLRGSERVAAMHQRDLAAEAGEEVGLFHGGIAAAHHHDLLLAVKEPVASGARTDAVADQLLLGRQIQPARFGARGHDQRAGFDPLAFEVQVERALRKIGFENCAMAIHGAEPLGLPFHVLDEIGAVDAFRKTGKVFDFGGERELAANLVTLHDERFETRPPGIYRGGIAGAAGTDDYNFIHLI